MQAASSAPAADEWLLTHEWFAGWRWEHYRHGQLADECLESYETLQECVANALARGCRVSSSLDADVDASLQGRATDHPSRLLVDALTAPSQMLAA